MDGLVFTAVHALHINRWGVGEDDRAGCLGGKAATRKEEAIAVLEDFGEGCWSIGSASDRLSHFSFGRVYLVAFTRNDTPTTILYNNFRR